MGRVVFVAGGHCCVGAAHGGSEHRDGRERGHERGGRLEYGRARAVALAAAAGAFLPRAASAE